MQCAADGGNVARVAREQLELQTGRKVVSSLTARRFFEKQKEVGDIDILVKMMDLEFTQVYRMCAYNHMRYINSQQDIDSLQQALNVMQRDLEVLNND